MIAAYNNSFSNNPVKKIICLTELDRDICYTGIVESFNKLKGKIYVSLLNVNVFQYSSSTPLYDLPKIDLSRPEDNIFIEEL